MTRKLNTTKLEIIQTATRMFLEKGYTATSVKSICDELEISTGNLTFYFPTKEHMLAILVEMLGDFQNKMMERAVNEGTSSLLAYALELPAMAAMCEGNDIARDFYISAYTHSMTMEIIRKNDILRAREVFSPYCWGWSEEQFTEAEILVSGIEYATLMTTPTNVPMDTRVAGAANAIMQIYQVPEEIRRAEVHKILAMDYRAVGQDILKDFMAYIEQVNERAFQDGGGNG